MDSKVLIDGLILYLCFIPVLTLHEFAHAWTASKCGDDTARHLGRVSINPAVHIDPIGTILLPLLSIFLTAGGGGALASFIIGWGKPVPVNIDNLNHRRRDDTLVAMAGPLMNILLCIPLLALCKVGLIVESKALTEITVQITLVSLFLCFFNLLPIPPLDGSHLVKNVIGMSDETYWRLCQFGFIAVIIVIQFDFVRTLLARATGQTFLLLAGLFGLRG